MKCYRIRDQNQIRFLMASQLARIAKSYDAKLKKLTLQLVQLDGRSWEVGLKMNEDDYALFMIRWERFHQSDEIFFDCAVIQTAP